MTQDSHAESVLGAVRSTLGDFDLTIATVDAGESLGRLVALEIASHLGVRQARRALARERQVLLADCSNAVAPRDEVTRAAP